MRQSSKKARSAGAHSPRAAQNRDEHESRAVELQPEARSLSLRVRDASMTLPHADMQK